MTLFDTCAMLTHRSRNKKGIEIIIYSRPLFKKSESMKFKSIIFR